MSKAGRKIYLDPAAVRSEYQRRLPKPHRRRGNHLPQTGFRISSRRHNQPLELALFDFLKSRRTGVARSFAANVQSKLAT
jgi:hypothetical protein